jgi:carbon monoxide dehydrogenase subunit G
MHLTNSFDVAASIDEVFSTILDVERVVVCLPGAEIVERTSDDGFIARITIRVGPIRMQYRSDVTITERDAEAHRAVMNIRAKESRGQGSADATATLTLTEHDGHTHGQVNVDMQVSGRVASMGQGAIQDVSNKLVATFATNLSDMFVQTHASNGSSGDVPAGAREDGADAAKAAAEPPIEPEPTPVAPETPGGDADSLSAVSLAGAVVSGRLREPRILAATLGLVAVLGFVAGRRSRGWAVRLVRTGSAAP